MTLTGETDMSLMLIAHETDGNYGLAAEQWRVQLLAIRSLPELGAGIEGKGCAEPDCALCAIQRYGRMALHTARVLLWTLRRHCP